MKNDRWVIGRKDIQYIVNNILKDVTDPKERTKIARSLTDDEILKEYYNIPLDIRKKNFINDTLESLEEGINLYGRDDNMKESSSKAYDFSKRALESFTENLTDEEFCDFLYAITKKAEAIDHKKGVTTINHGASGLSVLEAFIDYSEPWPNYPKPYDKRLIDLTKSSETDYMCKEVLKDIKKSKTTDIISMDMTHARKMTKIWENNTTPYMPADIFFANTISIMDSEIIIDQTELKKTISPDEANCKPDKLVFRVVIFDGLEKHIKSISNGDSVNMVDIIGAIIFKEHCGHIIIPIGIEPDNDNIIVPKGCILHKSTSTFRNKFFMSADRDSFVKRFQVAYRTWYSIQISMLHPIIKDIYKSNKSVQVDPQRNLSKKKNSQNKVKANNVRYYFINNDNDFSLHNKRGQITRHCSVWYVVGHYRTYKSGKKVFIKPHWRGPLRDFNNIKAREREIILREDNNENNS